MTLVTARCHLTPEVKSEMIDHRSQTMSGGMAPQRPPSPASPTAVMTEPPKSFREKWEFWVESGEQEFKKSREKSRHPI